MGDRMKKRAMEFQKSSKKLSEERDCSETTKKQGQFLKTILSLGIEKRIVLGKKYRQ